MMMISAPAPACTKWLGAAALLLASGSALAQQSTGETVFKAACVMCHQAQGQGAAGLAPPLKGSYWARLGAAPAYVPGVLLAGMHGPINTDDGVFSGVMPTQNRLSDADIAAVSNYVLQQINGKPDAAPVAAADVARLRAKPPAVAELRAMRKLAVAK